MALATAIAVHHPAQAQRNDSIDSPHVLPGVTVNDRHRQHNSVTSTAPKHIISQDQVLRMGITDIADALHRMPGITLRDYGGAGGMKTVSVRGFGARHTGVSYDGIMLSECQSGEIDVSRYSLDNVDNIALIVGDNDDIFIPARNAAYAATLNINTIPVPGFDLKPHLTAQLKVGSFGYTSPYLRYTQSVNRRLAITLSGEYLYAENDYPFILSNGVATKKEYRTNSRMNSAHGEAALAWKAGHRSVLEGKVYYYDNDRQLPGIVRYYTNISNEQLHDRNAFAQLRYRTWNGHNLSLKLNGKFNWASAAYTDGNYKGGINDATYIQREAYTSACLLFIPCQEVAVDYSADYSFNNLSSDLSTETRPFRHTVLQSLTAKYTGKRLTLTTRLLYSLYLNDAQDGPGASNMRRLSPSVSLSYRLLPHEDLYFRASYKNIFRAPTFNESYFFHYGSTDLKPENTDQYNVGLAYRRQFNKTCTLRLTADAYINHVTDKIVAVPYNMFVWTNINVGKVRTKGVECTADITQELGHGHRLLLNASYSWQQARNRTNPSSPYYNLQLAYTPEHQCSGALCYENPWVNLTLHGHAMSSRYANNEHYAGTKVAGYGEMGITAYRSFRWHNTSFELRGDIKNLLDKQYEIVSHYPMPGRSYQLTVNVKI